MKYQNLKYMVSPTNPENKLMIKVDINGVTSSVPIVPGNPHYDEIMFLEANGELTIADTDE